MKTPAAATRTGDTAQVSRGREHLRLMRTACRAFALLAVSLVVLAGLAPVASHAARATRTPRAVIERPPVVLLEQPVRVVAKLAGDGSGLFGGTIVVSRGDRRFDLSTVVIPAQRDTAFAAAIAELRRSMGWKGRYLFVTTSCGPGNNWKCGSDAVFTLVNGELVGLGSLIARAGAEYGTCWWGGAFHELDADFEGNDLTSHGNSPRIELLLHERGGRLVGDTDSTWTINATQFALNEGLARTTTQPEVIGYRRSWEFAISPRLENAMLAKYCGRTAALDSVIAEARGVLPAEVMGPFQELLARIEPGALPRRSRLLPAGSR
jgi:hypothetical protein